MTARRSRGARAPRGHFRLTPRDIEILATIARMRAPTSHQLALLFTLALSALHRRLRLFAAQRLVSVHAPDLNRPNIVTLTPHGRALVVAEGVAPEDIHVARHIAYHDVHAEMVNDVRVGIVQAARRRGDIELDAYLADWDLRRELGASSRSAYIPDALAVLRAGDATTSFAFEIDRGFESTSEIRKKVAATLALSTRGAALYGFTPWRPVVLVPTLRRLTTLARHIRDAGAGALWACGLLDARGDPLGPHYSLASALDTEAPSSALDAWLLPPA